MVTMVDVMILVLIMTARLSAPVMMDMHLMPMSVHAVVSIQNVNQLRCKKQGARGA